MQIRKATRKHRWGVILAGGEGVRLRNLTRLVSGDDRPKQFCRLIGGRTLLAQTRQRIRRTIATEKTLYVVLESHKPFFSNDLRGVHASRRVVQPANRGTLAAVLASLLRIVREDPFATIAFFPSDHDYNDDRKFMAGVDLAFGSAEINRDSVILLAVPAKHAEPGYGWIEAEAAHSEVSSSGHLRVKKFWEKRFTEVAS